MYVIYSITTLNGVFGFDAHVRCSLRKYAVKGSLGLQARAKIGGARNQVGIEA